MTSRSERIALDGFTAGEPVCVPLDPTERAFARLRPIDTTELERSTANAQSIADELSPVHQDDSDPWKNPNTDLEVAR